MNNARPTGAKAQAFHRLSGRTTRAAPAAPSRMRKPVQALGPEGRVRSFGKARETKKRESAMDARKRVKEDPASAGGISPGRIGGMEFALMLVWGNEKEGIGNGCAQTREGR